MNEILEKLFDLQISLMKETREGEYEITLDTSSFLLLGHAIFSMNRYRYDYIVQDNIKDVMVINGPGGVIKIHKKKNLISLDTEPF